MTEKKKKTTKKPGRPTIYSKKLADLICKRVATHTVGLKRLCAMYEDMPHIDTIYMWRSTYTEFSEQYAQAKLKQADLLAEECLDIADDATNDWMESLNDDDQGDGWKFNSEHYQRSRLRIDTRKWLASKLLPKQYGDKLQLEQKTEENEKLKQELMELRQKLNSQYKKEF